jgi:hypothetical protein
MKRQAHAAEIVLAVGALDETVTANLTFTIPTGRQRRRFLTWIGMRCWDVIGGLERGDWSVQNRFAQELPNSTHPADGLSIVLGTVGHFLSLAYKAKVGIDE